jgi:hypothetical protein
MKTNLQEQILKMTSNVTSKISEISERNILLEKRLRLQLQNYQRMLNKDSNLDPNDSFGSTIESFGSEIESFGEVGGAVFKNEYGEYDDDNVHDESSSWRRYLHSEPLFGVFRH